MTIPQIAQNYAIAFGASSNGASVPVFENRDPTPYDVNYPLGKPWVNQPGNVSFILTSFDSSSGIVLANWAATAAVGTVIGLHGDSGTALPSGGFITIAGGTGISTSAAGHTVTVSSTALPGTASFLAYQSAPAVAATGDGTAYPIVCDTVVSNTGGGYNAGTGIYTAPTTGLYEFNYTISVVLLGALHTDWDSVVSLSNAFGFGAELIVSPFVISVGGGVTLSASAIISMTVGDTAQPVLTIGTSTKTVTVFGAASGYFTSFSANLIGA